MYSWKEMLPKKFTAEKRGQLNPYYKTHIDSISSKSNKSLKRSRETRFIEDISENTHQTQIDSISSKSNKSQKRSRKTRSIEDIFENTHQTHIDSISSKSNKSQKRSRETRSIEDIFENTHQTHIDSISSKSNKSQKRSRETRSIEDIFENTHQTHIDSISSKSNKSLKRYRETRSIEDVFENKHQTQIHSISSKSNKSQKRSRATQSVEHIFENTTQTHIDSVSSKSNKSLTTWNLNFGKSLRRGPDSEIHKINYYFEEQVNTVIKEAKQRNTTPTICDQPYDLEEFDADMAGRKNLNKNAISAFEEYGVQHRETPKVDVVAGSGPSHRPIFCAVARLGDKEICREEGQSKHEARIKAAERALQLLSFQDHGTSNGVCEDADDETNPIPYKDPVSALMEYAQFVKLHVEFNLLSQEGPPHMPIFTYAVKLGDLMYNPVRGNSSKEAKKKAACMTLNTLKKERKLQALFPDTQLSALPVKKSKSKASLGVPGKNPVSVLNEYAQKICTTLKFESSMSGPPHKPVFTVTAVLGTERFPQVEASSKKQGHVLASETVLKTLEERGQYATPNPVLGQSINSTVSTKSKTHFDIMASTALRKIDELLLQTPESLVGRKVVAAIVLLDETRGTSTVVSLGSGNRCVKGSHISDNGTVVYDSHAEILARRGFKRYLYRLLQFGDTDLLVRGESSKWTFRPGKSFHLYISTAPCGDGALFTHSDKDVEPQSSLGGQHEPVFTNRRTQGLLRAKQENGEGTIPIEADFPGQTYDGIRQGERLRIMSCSDKICQWNVLGLQGALLSTFYEPVYLKSITLGSLFNPSHLSRAVCCRIDYGTSPLSSQLPAGYRVNHPDLGIVTSFDTSRAVERARPLSINWSYGDDEPEITDGTLGMTLRTVCSITAPSRICKRALLKLYRRQTGIHSEKMMTYKQLKMKADDYNQTKMTLQQRMHEQGYGHWIPMPREVDRF